MGKKTIPEAIAHNDKEIAAKIGVIVSPSDRKLHERIVPIPPVNTFAELPTGKVGGERKSAKKSRRAAAKSPARKSKKAAKKSPAKKAKAKKRRAAKG